MLNSVLLHHACTASLIHTYIAKLHLQKFSGARQDIQSSRSRLHDVSQVSCFNMPAFHTASCHPTARVAQRELSRHGFWVPLARNAVGAPSTGLLGIVRARCTYANAFYVES